MAITLEQERKPINWLSVLLTLIIVAVLFGGAYVLFFKKPELVEVVVPSKFENIQEISRLTFNPQELLTSPEFKLLKQYGGKISPPAPGRSNPFQPY